MKTQAQVAAHLDMTERNLRDVLKTLNLDWKSSTEDQIRVSYLRHLRDQAAGRNSADQISASRAKAEESQVKTALGRIAFNKEIRKLVETEESAGILLDWSGFANREFREGFEKLVSEIELKYKIKVDRELVDGVAGATATRIKGHAEKLGRDLVESIDDVFTSKEVADH